MGGALAVTGVPIVQVIGLALAALSLVVGGILIVRHTQRRAQSRCQA